MGSRRWFGTARNNTKNDSKAMPIAKAVAAGIAEPSRSHELQQLSLPLTKRDPSSLRAMRTPGGKSSNVKPNVRGNRLARTRCRNASSEGPKRQKTWKKG